MRESSTQDIFLNYRGLSKFVSCSKSLYNAAILILQLHVIARSLPRHHPTRELWMSLGRMLTLRMPKEAQESPTLPPVSSPRVAAKRLEDEKGLLYCPFLSTCPNLSRRFTRGILTPVNLNDPLSTPFRPTCRMQHAS